MATAGDTVVGFASAVHYVHPDKAPELWINEVGVAEPGDRIRCRVTPPPGLSSLAGSYASDAEYNETTDFDPEGRIVMVLVRLRAEATSGAAPPP
jgi:hypothetical protein